MKAIKLIVVGLAVLLSAGSLFAGGYIPGSKCSKADLECGMLGYQSCAEQFKVWDPTGGPTRTGQYVIDPSTTAFKSCEAAYKKTCMQSRGC